MKEIPSGKGGEAMRNEVLLSLLALALLLVAAPIALASVTKIPFTAQTILLPVSQGKSWTTPGDIQQAKGVVAEGNITGDITGTVRIVEDETLSLNTGQGVMHGQFMMTTTEGTFKGSFAGEVTGGIILTGKAVGQGTDTYEGQKIMGTYTGHVETTNGIPVTTLNLEGIILLSHV